MQKALSESPIVMSIGAKSSTIRHFRGLIKHRLSCSRLIGAEAPSHVALVCDRCSTVDLAHYGSPTHFGAQKLKHDTALLSSAGNHTGERIFTDIVRNKLQFKRDAA